MWALERPTTLGRGRILANTPFTLIIALAASWVAVAGLVAAGWLAPASLRVASITAAHGGLLGVAVAWGAAAGGARLPQTHLIIPPALVAVGATAAVLDTRASVLYLLTPAWVAALTLRGRLEGLGLAPRVALRPALVGVALGALLGGHLLLSASYTLGYALRGGATAILALWAYDAGANVLSAECFFRGALFNRLQRRWSFAAAASLATAAALLRYVVDPLLPKHVEVLAGALFYLTIVSAVDCWLLWWSGSLVPGLLASWMFFLAYRTLAIG